MDGIAERFDVYLLAKSCIRRAFLLVLIFLATSAVLTGYYLYILFDEPNYVTKSTLLLFSQNMPSSAGTFSNGRLDYKDLKELKDLTSTSANLVKNRLMIETVIRQTGIQTDNIDAFIDNHISFASIAGTPFMELAVSYPDPEISFNLNKKIIESLRSVSADIGIDLALTVIDYPLVPDKPDLPSVTLLAVTAFSFSAILYIIILVFDQTMYNTFRSDEDIEKCLSMDSLGALPKVTDFHDKNIVPYYSASIRKALSYIISAGSKSIALTSIREGNYYEIVRSFAQNLRNLGYSVLIVSFSDSFRVVGQPYHIKRLDKEMRKDDARANRSMILEFTAEAVEKYDYVIFEPLPYSIETQSMDVLNCADICVFLLDYNITVRSKVQFAVRNIRRQYSKVNLCALLTNMPYRGVFSPFGEYKRSLSVR